MIVSSVVSRVAPADSAHARCNASARINTHLHTFMISPGHGFCDHYMFCCQIQEVLRFFHPCSVRNTGNFKTDSITRNERPVLRASQEDLLDGFCFPVDAVYLLVVKRPAQAADIEIDFHLDLRFNRSVRNQQMILKLFAIEDKRPGWQGESDRIHERTHPRSKKKG